jgi:sortase A
MTRSRRRKRRWVELILLLVGIAGIGIWAWSQAHQSVYQDWNSWVFDRQRSGETVSVQAYLKERVTGWLGEIRHQPKPAARAAKSPAPPPAIADNGVVGRIRIPRLRLTAMVRQGTGARTLDVAVGHIPGTALPGDKGNVAVAGHRDTFFRGLRNIRQGDLIDFETLRGSYVYRVESTEIVKPQDVSVLNAGAWPELTLVTCYPFYYIGSAPDRFIVKARQLGGQSDTPPVRMARVHVAPRVYGAPPVKVAPKSTATPARGGPAKVDFEVARNHSRQIAPGISMGLTGTDPIGKRVEGWMWLTSDRRTIWLRDRSTREPLDFYEMEDGKRRELVITSVSANSARGYLLIR